MEIKFEADYPSGGQKTGIMAIGGGMSNVECK